REKAKPALKRCLDQSVKFQYFDQYSRDCETWLGKNYKSEYHIVDELRGAPTLSNSGLDDRPPPLILGGQLWPPPPSGPSREKAGSGNTNEPNQPTDGAGKPKGGDGAGKPKGGDGAARPKGGPPKKRGGGR